jgi:hypothetical protein
MKNYKYFYAIGFSALGIIIGYLIGLLVSYLFILLPQLMGVKSIGGGGIMGMIGYFFGFLPFILFYLAIIIGAIKGWKYGYKIGSKKDTAS